MPLSLDEVFFHKSSARRSPMSVKVYAGIVGRCWQSACQNKNIAESLSLSSSVVSEAINNHLSLSGIITFEYISKKRSLNTVNFTEIVSHFFSLISKYQESSKFANDDLQQKILSNIIDNRKATGEFFLESFVQGGAYDRGLKVVKQLYEQIPDLLLLLILSFDQSPKDKDYVDFLREVYSSIALRTTDENPQLANITFQWFNLIDKI